MGYTAAEMRRVLVASCIASFLAPLASTMMNLSLVAIGEEFSVGSHDLGMVSTSFLLASVMVMIPVTKLADIWGLRKVFLTGLALLGGAAAAACLTPSFPLLLAMRALMGVGAACLAVTGISLITNIFPANRRGWAIGMNSMAVYLGLAMGPVIGGFLTDAVGWRYLLSLLVPLSVISAALMLGFKDNLVMSGGQKFDFRGSAVYAMMICILMYGVINLPATWAVAMIAVGSCLFAVFVAMMRRSPNPVLDITIFRHREFSASCVATFLNYASSHSVAFFFALYLQHIGALSATQAGAVMLIQPLMQVLVTSRAGALSDRVSDKRLLPTIGMSITALGTLAVIFLGQVCDLRYVAAVLITLGLGFGIFSAPNTSLIMSSVPPKDRSAASGAAAIFRQTGMMVSMGIAMCCISFIMGTSSTITPATHEAFVDVIHMAFSICFLMCLAGIALTWFGVSKPSDDSS